MPAYSALDGVARGVTRARAPRAVPAINHLRFPAAISGAMLLVYFPLILVRADGNYVRATGHHVTGFAARWLTITAGLFLASGACLPRARQGVTRSSTPSTRPVTKTSPVPSSTATESGWRTVGQRATTWGRP